MACPSVPPSTKPAGAGRHERASGHCGSRASPASRGQQGTPPGHAGTHAAGKAAGGRAPFPPRSPHVSPGAEGRIDMVGPGNSSDADGGSLSTAKVKQSPPASTLQAPGCRAITRRTPIHPSSHRDVSSCLMCKEWSWGSIFGAIKLNVRNVPGPLPVLSFIGFPFHKAP